MSQASSHGRGEDDEGRTDRIRVLEGEIKKAKESERKMLESLVTQTKQLEQTKMELEEARLEMRSLQKSIREPDSSRTPSARNLFRSLLEKPPPSASAQTEEDEVATKLKDELRLAIQAEEKSKEAMDGLAVALKEVTEEVSRAKEKLAAVESELVVVRAEADCLRSALAAKEDNFRVVLAEAERLRLEAEESVTAWSAKEEGLISCVRASDEEVEKVMKENRRLLDEKEEAREENSRLRDIMKQALEEANVAKTGLEVARRENSQLKSLLAEKERSSESNGREEFLNGGEATAVATAFKSRSTRSIAGSKMFGGPVDAEENKQAAARVAKSLSERWRNGTSDDPAKKAADEATEIGSFREIAPAGAASSWKKSRSTQGTALGCASNVSIPSLFGLGSCGATGQKAGAGSERRISKGRRSVSSEKQKRKQILKKFDQLLRRRKTLENYERVATGAGPF